MLQSLSVQNYALIQQLHIRFQDGFSIITGETGAGKSIILGAMALITGQRADTSVLKDKSQKCVVEANFILNKKTYAPFFDEHDLDFEETTILRREINKNGKSRAFINDTPVNVSDLKEIGLQLIDIHSQHQSLYLNNPGFQLMVVDHFAKTTGLLETYKREYQEYKKHLGQLQKLQEEAEKAKADQDYYQFQFDQLEKAKLQENEQEELEKELETLTHAEEIKTNLGKASGLLSEDNDPVISRVGEIKNLIAKIENYFPGVAEFRERVESTLIELQDISGELELLAQDVEFEPGRLEFINERLDLIYELQQKHREKTVAGLITIKEDLGKKLKTIMDSDFQITQAQEALDKQKERLYQIAGELSGHRKQKFPELEERITGILVQLGIPNAKFRVKHDLHEDFKPEGIDAVQFLFSANKQAPPEELSKVASGGEISRAMLALKSIISSSNEIPTIIFDEIDAGVSGEIAHKMGNILKEMAGGMQVINITHLPQVASKGDHHFKVFKEENHNATLTRIKKLNPGERIEEIAKMLSGESLTEAALSNARELLSS